MVLHLMQDATTWLTQANMLADANLWANGISLWPESGSLAHWPTDWLLAQQVPQTDIVGDLQKWFNNLVKTGQLWAFLLGIIVGYLIKTFTSFG